jgi:hypothetical protein
MKIAAKSIAHDQLFSESVHPGITVGNVYIVVGIDDTNFRIISDFGEPVLYEKEIFDVVDSTIPPQWIRRDYGDGEYFIDPPELSRRGFYEDYFDGVPDAVEIFEVYRAAHTAQ